MLLKYDKKFSIKWLMNYLMVIAGSAIMAFSYVFFLIPNKITPGGVFGISIVIHHLSGLPTGMISLIINIPLLVWGIKVLGPKFGAKTIFGMVLTSSLIDLVTYFWGNKALLTGGDQMMLSALFGGIGIGAGLALVFKGKATTGGTDIVVQILTRKLGIPIGRLVLMIDTSIVITAIIAFKNPNLAMYSIITIFSTAKVLDTIMSGVGYYKTLFIISDKHEEIKEKIIKKIYRGGTYLKAEGLYFGTERKIIFTSVNRREMVALIDYVKNIDPSAFITVTDAAEILGKGFKPLSVKD